MHRLDQVSAYILSGGISSRMGEPKGLLQFGREPLIVRMARLLEPLVSSVTVIGLPELYGGLGLKVIEDHQFGDSTETDKPPGPLSGIATALKLAQTEWNFILACDLPYLSAEWLSWFMDRATHSDAQIVMPRTSGGLEPLAALYRRDSAELIIAALENGIRKVTDATRHCRVEFISDVEWKHIDPCGHVLRNMNTRQDYEEARMWMEGRRP